MNAIKKHREICLSLAVAVTLLLLNVFFILRSPANGAKPIVTSEEESETPMTASLEALVGVVTGPGGIPVIDASVNPQSLDHPSNPISHIGIITDAQGRYRWLLLPGRYSITVYKEGFRRATQTIAIAAGEPARLDFVLEPAP